MEHNWDRYSLLMLMKSLLRIMPRYTISNRDTTLPRFFSTEKKMNLEFSFLLVIIMFFVNNKVETGLVHSTSVYDLTWYKDDTQILSVGGDCKCQLMEVETQQIIQTAQHHEKSIKCISKTEDNSVIATGGRDGKIFFYDPRLGLHKKIGDFSFT